ncbi:SIS domain-containing protein [Pseudactinotalea sp. Z1739]|uniref:SIS domain-containing protein n=1 Tax=Pseudactinotalea sp. Z1739 TaxID=3413028 RepID=UPI003C7B475A
MTSHDRPGALGAQMEAELRSQPQMWRRAGELAAAAPLPEHGEKVAIIGCGTSWFMAQSYAALREASGAGLTDAWQATEAPLHRDYDVVIGLSRSGTTTEVIEALEPVRGRARTLSIVADPSTPLPSMTDDVIDLGFADEQSVVQTRFATTALSLLRASLGVDLSSSITDCGKALDAPLPDAGLSAEQITFLGSGWTIGLAHEAALKNREASQAWTESYPAMDYRHGPVAIAGPNRLTWNFGAAPQGLREQVEGTGATFLADESLDPLADLVLAQRVALERARLLNLDADQPRGLTRSVILDD